MQLSVTVEGIRGLKSSGWGVYACDQGTCVGVIPFQVRPGDRLELSGDWQRSKYNGQMQFAFVGAMPIIAHEPRALLSYACEITKGLGERKAEEIWAAYGSAWQTDPELLFIGGISAETRSAWGETLVRIEQQAAQSQTMAFLIGHQATMKMAAAAWSEWRQDTVARVTANPYELATLPHYSFADVDGEIRRSFGIGDDDPRRVEAATLYALNQQAARGDTAIALQALVAAVCGLVPANGDEVIGAIKALQERCALRWLDGHVAREADYQAETAVGVAFGLLNG